MSNTQQLEVDDSKPAGEATLDDAQPPPAVEAVVNDPGLDRTADGEVDEPSLGEELTREPALDEPALDEPALMALADEPVTEVSAPRDAPGDQRPRAAASEVRQFIATLRRERKARARARRLKRLGWAVAAAAAAGYLAARSNDPDAPGVSPGPQMALAADSESLPREEPRLPDPPPAAEDDLLALGAGAEPLTDTAQCEESFAQQRWRTAVESCTRVFEQTPGAPLALRIAHAHYARGQSDPAGFWARTALGLGTRDADAYVLIGHSERQAGHTKNAVDAYRRYLESSPRGWHAKRLRAALRELQPRPAYRQPSARRTSERTL